MTDQPLVAAPVVVLGPTASGKSDVAMAVARSRGDVSIIAADAMQVYRGMDIGTAKPTRADRDEIPHYCLDLAVPSERFTVAEFQRAYTDALDDIARHQRRALVVGGTGLYVTAAVDGLTLPGEWPHIRAELEQVDVDTLVAELREADPEALSRIDPNNKRRLVRALEVCRGSGRPFSSFGAGVTEFSRTDVRQIGIRWTRDALAQRIAHRVDAMIDGGLLDEVRSLRAAGEFSLTASQALGYKEMVDHLDGRCSLEEARDLVVLRTRQFAVRQERWYRRDPRIEWIDVTSDPVDEIAPVVLRAMA